MNPITNEESSPSRAPLRLHWNSMGFEADGVGHSYRSYSVSLNDAWDLRLGFYMESENNSLNIDPLSKPELRPHYDVMCPSCSGRLVELTLGWEAECARCDEMKTTLKYEPLDAMGRGDVSGWRWWLEDRLDLDLLSATLEAQVLVDRLKVLHRLYTHAGLLRFAECEESYLKAMEETAEQLAQGGSEDALLKTANRLLSEGAHTAINPRPWVKTWQASVS